MSNIKTVYHGSTDIVKVPVYGYGKTNNDYGIGFYCTDDNRAGSLWSVNKGEDLTTTSWENFWKITLPMLSPVILRQATMRKARRNWPNPRQKSAWPTQAKKLKI